jgi:hypothetical protein
MLSICTMGSCSSGGSQKILSIRTVERCSSGGNQKMLSICTTLYVDL